MSKIQPCDLITAVYHVIAERYRSFRQRPSVPLPNPFGARKQLQALIVLNLQLP
jgi:hypothetical protein